MTTEERGRIYVSNLPIDITENELKNIFGKYGEILDIFYINSKNLNFKRVYITYPSIANARSAVAATNYHDIGGNQLTVQMTKKEFRRNDSKNSCPEKLEKHGYRYYYPRNMLPPQDPYNYQQPQQHQPQYQTYQSNYDSYQQASQSSYQYEQSRYQDYYRAREVPPPFPQHFNQQPNYNQYNQNQQNQYDRTYNQYQTNSYQYQQNPTTYQQYSQQIFIPPPIQQQNPCVY